MKKAKREETKAIPNFRLPAIWAYYTGSSSARKLHIVSNVNGNAGYVYNTKEVPKGEWVKVQVKQVYSNSTDKFTYSIILNNKVVHSIENKKSAIFK